jgi:hypothetical protein
VGVELFHADGQTDMMNLIVAFRNFANAPKNGQKCRKDKEEDVSSDWMTSKKREDNGN